jgi:uncharacterized membrane protein
MYKFFLIFIILIILDFIYINFSQTFYENEMGIKYSNVKMIPAILAWTCVGTSYYYIVKEPFENKYLRGLMLALGMYGVYNMTNLAILPNYSNELALRDTLWGTSLIMMLTFISQFIPNFASTSINNNL